MAKKKPMLGKLEAPLSGAKEEVGVYRTSAQLIEQRLKHEFIMENPTQLKIWGKTIEEMETAGMEPSDIAIGINLTANETTITDCFAKLLHERSQTIDHTKENYYSGDTQKPNIVQYGGGESTTPSPVLNFSLYEIAKEYKGKNPSGRDMERVQNILTGLLNKTFLMDFKVHIKNKRGEYEEAIIRRKDALIMLGEKTKNPDKEDAKFIILHPIFASQIRTKYVNYPIDINKRTVEAYGSSRPSKMALNLRDYLATIHGANQLTTEIYLSNLYNKLAPEWMRESRKKKVEEGTLRAIETVVNLGLVEKWEKVAGKTGETKIVFTLNKGWLKKKPE